jgi:calcium binding protein 39
MLQVFVANPNKSRPVVEVLVNNKDKLLTYLRDFHTDKGKPAATPAALPAAQPP